MIKYSIWQKYIIILKSYKLKTSLKYIKQKNWKLTSIEENTIITGEYTTLLVINKLRRQKLSKDIEDFKLELSELDIQYTQKFMRINMLFYKVALVSFIRPHKCNTGHYLWPQWNWVRVK